MKASTKVLLWLQVCTRASVSDLRWAGAGGESSLQACWKRVCLEDAGASGTFAVPCGCISLSDVLHGMRQESPAPGSAAAGMSK